MDTLWHDVRFAIRGFARSPGFTALVVLTLAIGIGATTGVFSAVHAVLLATMPYPDAEELVLGRRTQDGRVGSWVAMLDYLDYREQATGFESLAAVRTGANRMPSSAGDRPERVNVQTVSFNLFSTLGVAPILGRSFSAEEGSPEPAAPAGAAARATIPPVAVISFAYWQRSFGGAPGILGRTLRLLGEPVTVIGVMPEGFRFLADADVWVPMRPNAAEARRYHNWYVVGRLKRGVTIAQAQSEIDAISARLAALYPDSNAGKGLHLDGLHEALVESLRPQVLLIMAAVAVMLLIASANVASLLLARGVTRRGELATRAALGASQGQLIRQLVVEAILLSLLGGVTGLAIAAWLQRILPALLDLNQLGVATLHLDPRIVGFASVLSLLTGVGAGVAPALRSSSVSLAEEFKGAARTTSSVAGARLRMVLVGAQVTLSLVLLVGSSLLIRSFARLVGTDLGFDPDHLLTATFDLPPQKYASDEARVQFFGALLADIRAIAGVTAAGMVDRLPILAPSGDVCVWTPDNPPRSRTGGDAQTSLYRRALPGYFTAMRMSLLAGRDIGETDRSDAPPVLVINQTMARALFGSLSPIGRKVVVDWPNAPEPIAFEVVGVVADARVSRVGNAPYPTMYSSFYQLPSARLSVAIRSGGDPQALTRSLRAVVGRLDRDIPVDELATMTAAIRDSTMAQRTLATTVSAFSLLALLLAGIGLFGVLAYQVNQRRHEIGVRMALGARHGHILAAVVRQGLAVTAAGLAAGVVTAVALTRLMTSLLYEVTPGDPASFAFACATLVLVALLACLVPALRALRVQPITALRYE